MFNKIIGTKKSKDRISKSKRKYFEWEDDITSRRTSKISASSVLNAEKQNIIPVCYGQAHNQGASRSGPLPFSAKHRKYSVLVPSLYQKGHFPSIKKAWLQKFSMAFVPGPDFSFAAVKRDCNEDNWISE